MYQAKLEIVLKAAGQLQAKWKRSTSGGTINFRKQEAGLALDFHEEFYGYREERDSIWFGAKDGEKYVTCFVSREALGDFDGGIPDVSAIEATFRRRRYEIEAAADAKYAAGLIEPDGSLSLTTQDYKGEAE